ncbi:hypothetical protein OPT61_g686 [Boeremia exigua]|uniref:Uncharacterized protein n=1 Tax=Boeremia exigua TaxID=749465 RepID=A0ACC2ISZ3_9PLEO|nr:hypothetical protein OPT61_g686 [Boeremia exigua]
MLSTLLVGLWHLLIFIIKFTAVTFFAVLVIPAAINAGTFCITLTVECGHYLRQIAIDGLLGVAVYCKDTWNKSDRVTSVFLTARQHALYDRLRKGRTIARDLIARLWHTVYTIGTSVAFRPTTLGAIKGAFRTDSYTTTSAAGTHTLHDTTNQKSKDLLSVVRDGAGNFTRPDLQQAITALNQELRKRLGA